MIKNELSRRKFIGKAAAGIAGAGCRDDRDRRFSACKAPGRSGQSRQS